MNESLIQAPYEVQIVSDAGQPLPVMDFHGKPCARSQCGMTYNIKVIVHRDINGVFPSSNLRIYAEVDGRWVGYNRSLRLTATRYKGENQASVRFDGFRDSNDDICEFKFGPIKAVYCSKNSSTASQKEVGSISIFIYAMERTICNPNTAKTKTKNPIRTPVKEPSSQVHIEEDKKFWQSPSVVTVSGEKLRRHVTSRTPQSAESTQPTFKWKCVGVVPLAKLTLYYHSAEMFDFLKDFQARPPTATAEPAAASSDSAVVRPLPPVQVLPGGGILVDLTAEEDEATVVLPTPLLATTAKSSKAATFATTPISSTPTAATTPAAVGRPSSPAWERWMHLVVEEGTAAAASRIAGSAGTAAVTTPEPLGRTPPRSGDTGVFWSLNRLAAAGSVYNRTTTTAAAEALMPTTPTQLPDPTGRDKTGMKTPDTKKRSYDDIVGSREQASWF